MYLRTTYCLITFATSCPSLSLYCKKYTPAGKSFVEKVKDQEAYLQQERIGFIPPLVQQPPPPLSGAAAAAAAAGLIADQKTNILSSPPRYYTPLTLYPPYVSSSPAYSSQNI